MAAVGAALCASSSGTSLPLAPLSSLGRLQPAPYPGAPGPELVPIPHAPRLASPVSRARPGKTIDGIQCEFNPRLVSHVHVHLTVFVNGKPRTVPAGIGFWPPLGPQNYRHGQFGVTPGSCWSSHRTKFLRPIPAGGSLTVDWPMEAVNHGSFDVYVTLVSPHALGRDPAIGPAVRVAVADRKTLNSGGILPLALGIPAFLGLLTLGLRYRRGR